MDFEVCMQQLTFNIITTGRRGKKKKEMNLHTLWKPLFTPNIKLALLQFRQSVGLNKKERKNSTQFEQIHTDIYKSMSFFYINGRIDTYVCVYICVYVFTLFFLPMSLQKPGTASVAIESEPMASYSSWNLTMNS